MNKSIQYILILILFASCEYLPTVKNDEVVIAKVNDKFLYESDIKDVLPPEISKQDSILFIKNYIDTWAKEQLLLNQAEINLKDETTSFEKLVSDYRSTLYINSYKEALVLNKLDTTVTKEQIENYYLSNHQNFKLNEELVQLKFIYTNKNRSDKKELIKLFKSNKKEDLDSLKSRSLEFKSFNFNDSIWVKYNDLENRISALKDLEKNQILKKSNFIQKEDSLGLYLITIKDVLNRNEIAPIGYITPTIKQIILQKRKLELLRKIEVDLLNDAIKNQNFEKY
ncbi:hypothetical protein [Urechidicola croceus]|uniref:Peptidylprolyl isomerase n=1 Tax=Urechidicola croceus TaxID=1850246 RepID=A0A1D8P4S8_9FLAO|nr:hypothetical protein [Urechidicola croceus]AOW19557.1 hypothetical protein LPB138_02180 [Urechidicola croceus]